MRGWFHGPGSVTAQSDREFCDYLRRSLQEVAESVEPAADGLDRIVTRMRQMGKGPARVRACALVPAPRAAAQ
jgi:hypothetical protein